MKTKWETYQELELISEAELRMQSKKAPLRQWLRSIWESFLMSLSDRPEPQVWKACNKDGSIYWRVYNPVTGRMACLGSEEEVLAWIEQSYYQSQRTHSYDNYPNNWIR